MPFALTLFSIQIFQFLFLFAVDIVFCSLVIYFNSILFEHFFSNLFPLFILIMHEASFIMRCEHILIARTFLGVAVVGVVIFFLVLFLFQAPYGRMERCSSICIMRVCVLTYCFSVHVWVSFYRWLCVCIHGISFSDHNIQWVDGQTLNLLSTPLFI